MRLATFALALTLSCATSASEKSVPVRIGQTHPDLDACTSIFAVAGLKNSSLNVRTGPGTRYPRVDSLTNDQQVWACDSARNGSWLAVVYAPLGTELDCGVTSPVSSPRTYQGPCRSGWVRAKWLVGIAG